jgi:hypothetical protein
VDQEKEGALMNRITFPIEPENTGDAVANLQDGLQLLPKRRIFHRNGLELSRIRSGLQSERVEGNYDTLALELIALP